jgi:hypothetical protein
MPDEERFCPGTCVPVLKIGGNVSRLRAKPAHLVGHLPASQRSDFCVQYKDERNWAVLLETQEPAGKQGATTPGMQPMAKERERNLEGRGCKQ